MFKYSDIALKTLAIKVSEKLTNKQFYDRYSDPKSIYQKFGSDSVKKITSNLIDKFDSFGIDGFVCDKDKEFPIINTNVTPGERPYLLFYKGNLKLLDNLNNNVAVIGLRDPDNDIVEREIKIVKSLVNKGMNIVSGLAEGCDTIAHKTTIINGGNTVAILPSTIQKIIPKSNIDLANDIVNKNSLLISEYFEEPKDRYESIKRFVERDRLQAMFSKTVVLIASYEKGKGDSGSRHAMEKAKKYGLCRYVMYDKFKDSKKLEFELNKNFYNNEKDVNIFNHHSNNDIYKYYITSLDSSKFVGTQLKFDF